MTAAATGGEEARRRVVGRGGVRGERLLEGR